MEALEAPAPSYKIVLVPALMLINGCGWCITGWWAKTVSRIPSWPGLSRPSTSSCVWARQFVDARHKAGHDQFW